MTDLPKTELFARQIQVLLSRGNFEGARLVVAEAERSFRNGDGSESNHNQLDTALAETNLPQRVVNRLEADDFLTIRDLLHARRKRLLAIDGIGETSLRLILAMLREMGFSNDQCPR